MTARSIPRPNNLDDNYSVRDRRLRPITPERDGVMGEMETKFTGKEEGYREITRTEKKKLVRKLPFRMSPAMSVTNFHRL